MTFGGGMTITNRGEPARARPAGSGLPPPRAGTSAPRSARDRRSSRASQVLRRRFHDPGLLSGSRGNPGFSVHEKRRKGPLLIRNTADSLRTTRTGRRGSRSMLLDAALELLDALADDELRDAPGRRPRRSRARRARKAFRRRELATFSAIASRSPGVGSSSRPASPVAAGGRDGRPERLAGSLEGAARRAACAAEISARRSADVRLRRAAAPRRGTARDRSRRSTAIRRTSRGRSSAGSPASVGAADGAEDRDRRTTPPRRRGSSNGGLGFLGWLGPLSVPDRPGEVVLPKPVSSEEGSRRSRRGTVRGRLRGGDRGRNAGREARCSPARRRRRAPRSARSSCCESNGFETIAVGIRAARRGRGRTARRSRRAGRPGIRAVAGLLLIASQTS